MEIKKRIFRQLDYVRAMLKDTDPSSPHPGVLAEDIIKACEAAGHIIVNDHIGGLNRIDTGRKSDRTYLTTCANIPVDVVSPRGTITVGRPITYQGRFRWPEVKEQLKDKYDFQTVSQTVDGHPRMGTWTNEVVLVTRRRK